MKKIISIFILGLIFSCSSSSDDGPPPPPPVVAPSAANLVFPSNNQECNEGNEVNATQTNVTFQWEASDNTDSYDVVVKNLNTDASSTYSSSTNEKSIIIDKATPYSWYVISKSNSTTETAQSSTWKFYNAGDGVISYVPFPAELVAPSMGANLSSVSTVSLEWTGNDLDNDITGYSIYFDTSSPPSNLESENQSGNTLSVNVSAGNTYYWRVTTIDAEGNNSQSEIFEFRVD